jgi:hypothetical protein
MASEQFMACTSLMDGFWTIYSLYFSDWWFLNNYNVQKPSIREVQAINCSETINRRSTGYTMFRSHQSETCSSPIDGFWTIYSLYFSDWWLLNNLWPVLLRLMASEQFIACTSPIDGFWTIYSLYFSDWWLPSIREVQAINCSEAINQRSTGYKLFRNHQSEKYRL